MKEEELLNSQGYNWPHDLFFVKQRGDHYDRLGWDGNLQDISSVVNKNQVRSTVPAFSQFLTRNCNYFATANIPSYSCEVYEAVELNMNERGYIVRHIPLTEETELFLSMLLPLVSLIFVFNIFNTNSIPPYALTGFISVFLPLFVAFITVNLFENRKRHKRSQ